MRVGLIRVPAGRRRGNRRHRDSLLTGKRLFLGNSRLLLELPELCFCHALLLAAAANYASGAHHQGLTNQAHGSPCLACCLLWASTGKVGTTGKTVTDRSFVK